jgi:hypothetical protein
MRKKYFSLKELRLSIAHMVLWSLLTIAFFTYLTIEMGDKVDRGPLYFIGVILVYASVVVILTLIFTHRFIGPFERLKMQLRIILSGNYHKRLNIRKHDDIYVNSFISEVNVLIDKLEKVHFFHEESRRKIDSELARIKSLTEKDEVSKEELRKAMVGLRTEVDKIFVNEES